MMSNPSLCDKLRLLAAAGALACLPSVAGAAALDNFQAALTDAQLDQMRGRFAQDGQIAYFGVTMQTQWQMAAGGTINAGLNIAMQGGGKPSVTLDGGGNAAPADMAAGPGGIHLQAGGLQQVQGVAQSIQIGGDGNTVTNDVNIDVTWLGNHQPPTHVPPRNGTAVPAGGELAVTQGGIETRAAARQDALSLDLKAPGQGEVLQQLKSGSGILQSVLLSSNFNQIHNTFSITAQIQPMGSLNVIGINTLLDTLKGLP